MSNISSKPKLFGQATGMTKSMLARQKAVFDVSSLTRNPNVRGDYGND